MGKRVVMISDSVAPGSPHPFQLADWAVTPATGRDVSSIKSSAVIEVYERGLSEQAGNVSR